MKKIGDIVSPLGSYTDRSSGMEKTRWGKCGVLMQNDEGKYRIKLDMLPVNIGDGWLSVFEEEQQKPAQQAPLPPIGEANKDLPF